MKYFITISFLFFVAFANAQTLQWAKAMGGINSNDGGFSITTDASGNVYTTGNFWGTADFDPGPGIYNLTSAGWLDIFISKLDASGNFVWAKAMGAGGHDRGRSITTDASGNVYTTGDFIGIVDFDPGAGTFNLTGVSNSHIFISKLDATGNFIWAKSMDGTAGLSIAIDPFDNVYTTGNFLDTADFDPSAGVFNLTSKGFYDIFISKLDSSGNFVWAKAMGGTGFDSGRSITIDAFGNVFITGQFAGTADFDPDAGTFNLTSSGSYDIFISKLDTSGNFIWAKAIGGAASDGSSAIATDASGNVYTTGYFESTADFDPSAATFNLISTGLKDIFISKLDSSGSFAWAVAMGGTASDGCGSVRIDAANNVYTTGGFEGTVDFDPGAGIFNLTSAGLGDIFIYKSDASGNFVWANAVGGTAIDGGTSITIDAFGNIYTTGSFTGTVDFDSGVSVFNLTSSGGNDIFVQKIGQPAGVYENNNDNILFVSPNPTTGIFTIQMINGNTSTINHQPLTIEVYNVLGEKVHSLSPSGGGAGGGFAVDLSNQPSGIYFYKVESKNETITGKLIIE